MDGSPGAAASFATRDAASNSRLKSLKLTANHKGELDEDMMSNSLPDVKGVTMRRETLWHTRWTCFYPKDNPHITSQVFQRFG